MADLATDDPRAAAWERRLRPAVLTAAVAVLPLLALHLTHPHGALARVETAGHWIVWLVFMVEVVVMLRVVGDRRAWIDGHRFELLVGARPRGPALTRAERTTGRTPWHARVRRDGRRSR